jgi:hypothetical protein
MDRIFVDVTKESFGWFENAVGVGEFIRVIQKVERK